MAGESSKAPATTADRVNAILAEREARGLRVPVLVRLLLALFIIPSVSGALAEMENLGTFRVIFGSMLVSWMAINLWFFTLLRRERHVARVGIGGAVLDVVFVGAQLLLGLVLFDSSNVPPTAVFKSQLPAFGVALVSINALALRPRYPLIVGVGCFLGLGGTLLMASRRPNFVVSQNPVDYLAGPAAGAMELANLFFFYAFVTTAIVVVTHVARKTIRRALTQEIATSELLMREKVEALGKLVAGVSHELNSPLGVIRSGLDTHDKLLTKVEEKVADKDRKLVARARSISESLGAAAARIARTAESLRSFAHLDEAQFQKVDLAAWAATLTERNPPPETKTIEVAVHIDGEPSLYANAPELTQAVSTILQNAYDAIAGEGEVRLAIAAEETEITIAVADTGAGMSKETMAGLFDVGLRSGSERVAASFGLPAAQSVAHRHGGRIEVESTLGDGSKLTLHLPSER